MVEKRQFELLLLRLVPHALRDDFMTVGVVVLEPGDESSSPASQTQAGRGPRFADVRFTRDWKRVECFAPDLELEIFEYLETAVRGGLKEMRRREDLVQLLEERFGTVFDVGPAKALVAADPAAEMRVLERDYLAPMQPVERARRLGRLGIVREMEKGFADAGVLELLQRDLDMKEFTGENDPFVVDFGFRVGRSLKMFQGLALNLSRDPAVTLAYRYSRIQAGMRGRGEEALMTAVISADAMKARGEVASGIAMLKANEIGVRSLGEMGEIAAEVKKEIRA
jgi:chorismate mutase